MVYSVSYHICKWHQSLSTSLSFLYLHVGADLAALCNDATFQCIRGKMDIMALKISQSMLRYLTQWLLQMISFEIL